MSCLPGAAGAAQALWPMALDDSRHSGTAAVAAPPAHTSGGPGTWVGTSHPDRPSVRTRRLGGQGVDSTGDEYFETQGKHINGFGPHGTKRFDVTASAPHDSYRALTGNGDLVIGDQAGRLHAIG